MKKFLLFGAVAMMAASAMAQDSSLVYFNSFEDEDLNGATIVGGGEIKDLGGAYGKVFSNAMDGMRENYLLLPEDVLSHNGDTEEITILFWVNRGNETDSNHYGWCPAFTAYGSAPSDNNDNTWPMLACQYRGVLQVNNAGWCDYTDAENVKGANALYHFETDWLSDGEWHVYAASFTPKTAKVSFDGNVVNEWAIPEEADNTAAGLFTNGADLKYICLGGNQAWNWGDPDPGFWFDDFAIYNKVLSEDDIKAIMDEKIASDGVANIEVDAAASVEYFDMNGVKVAAPSNGIYIKRQGNKASKVVVKR